MSSILRLFCLLILMGTGLRKAVAQATIGAGTIKNFNPVPPTPEAAAFQKYGDLPVSYNTGVPQISVPVYTIDVKGFSWPISLSYHASGFKSDDVATRVGLGWVINAGGLISSQQSITDVGIGTDPTGYLNLTGYRPDEHPDQCIYNSLQDIDLADWLANGTRKIAPEFFNINAGGISGKFIRWEQYGYMLPASDNLIQRINTSQAGVYNWKVTDPQGNVYEFNDRGANERISLCPGTPSLSSNPTYYLSKITTAKGETIVFNYVSEEYSYRTADLQVIKTLQPNQLMGCSSNVNPENYTCENVFQTDEKRLQSIECSNGTFVQFYYSSRLDIPGSTKLDKITISYKNGNAEELLKSVELKYGYFGEGSSNQYDLQLKLNRVQYSGKDNSVVQKYQFNYNSQALPNKLSAPISHLSTSQNLALYNISKAGILEKITYPTGGYTTFDYQVCTGYGLLRVTEMKDYAIDNQPTGYRSFNYNDNPSSLIDGVFIESESHHYFGTPVNGGSLGSNPCMSGYSLNEVIVQCDVAVWKSALIRNTLQEYMEAAPRFPNVTEFFGSNGSNGKIEYTYGAPEGNRGITDHYYLQKPEQLLEKKIFKKNTDGSYSLLKRSLNSYAVPPCAIDLFEASPVGTKEKRFWTKLVRLIRPEMTLQCQPSGSVCYPKIFDEQNFRISSVPLYLTNTTEEDYNGTEKLITSTNFFYQDSRHLNVTKSETTDSKGGTITTVYKYPHDFLNVAVYADMVARNMIAARIEETQSRNTSTLVKTKTQYKLWQNAFVEAEYTEKTIANNSAEREITVDNFDASGNVLQFTGKDDIARSFIWDYKNSYPIAECFNSSVSNIAFTSFEAEGKGNWSFSGQTASDINAIAGQKVYALSAGTVSTLNTLNASTSYLISYWVKNSSGTVSVNGSAGTAKIIRNGWTLYENTVSGVTAVVVSGSGTVDELRLHPAQARMTTYTYAPLTGMTTQSDINGNIIYYEYDQYGRLQHIRNPEGNILKKICYSLAGVSSPCGAFQNQAVSQSFTRNNCASGYTGSAITYTVPAGKYRAETQAEADALAQQEIDENGQQYANTTGTCTITCTTGNCTGQGKKCVNNICETGIKIYTGSVQIGAHLWQCTYHYEWSDGSWSQNYTEEQPTSCVLTES